MGIEIIKPGFIQVTCECSFVSMKNRIDLYEKAINDLHEAKMKLIDTTASKLTIETGLTVTMIVTAIFLALGFSL